MMRFICKKCEKPCIISVEECSDPPEFCPFGYDDCNEEWEEIESPGKLIWYEESCLKDDGERPAATPEPMSKPGVVEQTYRDGSVVSSRKSEIEKLVNAHWNYMEKVLTTGADKTRMFSFDEVMEIRELDYTSAAIHFYGHGFEDGHKIMAEKSLERLKEI